MYPNRCGNAPNALPRKGCGNSVLFIHGFTLIEVLVAVMILAISMTTVMQLFSGGLRANVLSEQYSLAVLHARAKMEELLLAEEMAPGVLEGAFDQTFEWKAEISLNRSENVNPVSVQEKDLALFDIRVDIMWRSGKANKVVTLSTLKIAQYIKPRGNVN